MTQNGTVRCGMPQRDQAREVTEICGFHKPNGDEEATLEPPAFGLRPDHGQPGSNASRISTEKRACVHERITACTPTIRSESGIRCGQFPRSPFVDSFGWATIRKLSS